MCVGGGGVGVDRGGINTWLLSYSKYMRALDNLYDKKTPCVCAPEDQGVFFESGPGKGSGVCVCGGGGVDRGGINTWLLSYSKYMRALDDLYDKETP